MSPSRPLWLLMTRVGRALCRCSVAADSGRYKTTLLPRLVLRCFTEARRCLCLSELDWNLCFHASFSLGYCLISLFSQNRYVFTILFFCCLSVQLLVLSCCFLVTILLMHRHSQLIVINSCKAAWWVGEHSELNSLSSEHFFQRGAMLFHSRLSQVTRDAHGSCLLRFPHRHPWLKQLPGSLFEDDPFERPIRELQNRDTVLFQKELWVEYSLKRAQKVKAQVRTSLYGKSFASIDRLKHRFNGETVDFNNSYSAG